VLMASVAGGDRLAFKRLYDRTSARLLDIVRRIVRDRSLAKETRQEVYLQIWRKAATYDATWRGRGLVLIGVRRGEIRRPAESTLLDASDRRGRSPRTLASRRSASAFAQAAAYSKKRCALRRSQEGRRFGERRFMESELRRIGAIVKPPSILFAPVRPELPNAVGGRIHQNWRESEPANAGAIARPT
jgi:hypothetical protein